MKKLFKESPSPEEMVALALGEMEAEYPCDFCLKECKTERGVSFVKVWCKKAEYPD